MAIQSSIPATGELLEEFAEGTTEETAAIIDQVAAAGQNWRETSFAVRTALMRRAAAELRSHQDDNARTMSLEMGKPIEEGRGEIEKCAWVCEYDAEHAEGFLRDEPAPAPAGK